MDVNTKKIIKYSVLPGIIPRLFSLITSGFSTLAYYIASVYNIVKLLPDDHPYLLNENIGKYGVRHVISAAAANLVFKRQNIDQIIIFFTILAGLIIIALQCFLLCLAFFASKDVFALTFPIPDLFNNPNTTTGSAGPEQDLAFIILDRVFGLIGIYESCISMNVACQSTSGEPFYNPLGEYPYPFHEALHQMLQFYSLGIIAIGALLIVYFIIAVVAETASTGTPFGQRFNRAWTPVRLVLFFAMIIPLNIGGQNEGLNGAQILTFWVAKHGSNFATNGWSYFNTTLTGETYLGPQTNIIATPNAPEMGDLNQFMLTAKTCAITMAQHHDLRYRRGVRAYVVRAQPPGYVTDNYAPIPGDTTPNALLMEAAPFGVAPGTTGPDQGAGALGFSLGGNIKIRFGEADITTYEEWGGNVEPTCGDITVLVNNVFEPGAAFIAEEYYNLIQNLWNDETLNATAACLVAKHINNTGTDPDCEDLPDQDYIDTVNTYFDTYVEDTINAGIERQRNDGDFLVPPELIEKGWAGAAIWFNRVAEMNGAVIDAVINVPKPDNYPLIMEEIFQKRLMQNESTYGENKYNPEMSDGERIRIAGGSEEYYKPIYEAYSFWLENSAADSIGTEETGVTVIDMINLVLGTSGIFEMRKNFDVHPLAQLTAIGKGMMEATIRNTAIATAGYVGGGLSSIIGGFTAEMSKVVSGFMLSVISASIGIAVILYYVLPFLPFIYFLFAVSGWAKSIFEAVVAMPLWALAHIRIDAQGIPGQDASNGYFLLVEIFLRPILILFGLIASISLFSALVATLNTIFDLLVTNVSGSDPRFEAGAAPDLTSIGFYRGPIDEFFFTAMYAIICYLVGISCFKLVDQIPNNILRWMGSNAATFQENAGDPAGKLTQNVYRGSVLVTNQVKGATQGNLAAIVSG